MCAVIDSSGNIIQDCLESPPAVWSEGEKIKRLFSPACTPFEHREQVRISLCQLQIGIADLIWTTPEDQGYDMYLMLINTGVCVF